jgi:hypothetical protein
MRWTAWGALALACMLACEKKSAVDSNENDGSGGQAGSGATPGTGGSGGSNGAGGNLGGAGASLSGDELSERYPGDVGIESDPAVLFFDDFEGGWGKWDAPTSDTAHLFIESGSESASGNGYLRSTVTVAQLEEDEYISASPRFQFLRTTETVYIRYYAQFRGISVTPHHWVRVAAGDEDFQSSGLANTVPAGDDGFWFDFDVNTDDVFNFYVYWYNMRSGRCNDGSAVPGCDGDQGSTYYYGNVFRPPHQTPFDRNEWVCIEMMARANAVGSSNGALAFWVNDELVGDYRTGYPNGTWLRDSFHTDGCEFSACTEPEPFSGFDFRSSDAVKFKAFFLDAYYERGSTASKRATLEERGLTVLNEQTIFYDDIVIADQRIGCRR